MDCSLMEFASAIRYFNTMSSHVTTEEDSSSSAMRKRVRFNEYGLPVGENYKQLSTRSGVLVRPHIPVSFDDWRAVPEHMKEELWKLLGKNKENRKCLDVYHTTGRDGLARLEDKMRREKGGDDPIPRTAVWVKGHIGKKGSMSSVVASIVEKLNDISQRNTNSEDLHNDPLTEIFGRDKNGGSRAIGTTVSRSQILLSAPAIAKLTEKESTIGIQKEDINQLKGEMSGVKDSLAQIMKAVQALKQSGEASQSATSHSLGSGATRSELDCSLCDWYGATVATGRVIVEAGPKRFMAIL